MIMRYSLRDKDDFERFVRSYQEHRIINTPDNYPCIVVFIEYDNPNGRNHFEYEFIHKADFPF